MARFRFSLLSSVSVVLAFAALAVPVHADSFTIGPGQTEGQQVLDGDGETGIIEEGGTISTSANGSAGDGVSSSGDNVVIDNRGTIETTGTDRLENGSYRSVAGIFSQGVGAQITNSGTIENHGVGSNGVLSTGSDARITNSGTIKTHGYASSGLVSTGGDGVRIINSGTIQTKGGSSAGIYADDDGARIINSGFIKTGTEHTGYQSYGIRSNGLDARITNSGMIETLGVAAHGIYSSKDGARITNSGMIETREDRAHGIYSSGDGARIINSGTIKTNGPSSTGILSFGDGARIINSGTIETQGVFYSLHSTGNGARITNSGTIRGTQASSIVISGNNATINLLPGSVLVGDLVVGQSVAATAALNIASGLSAVLNVAATSSFGEAGGFLNLPQIDTSGMPFTVAQNATHQTITTADITALRAQGAALGDLTSGIFGAVGSRRAAGTISAPLAYAPQAAPQTAIFRNDADFSREVWLRGFGGWRGQDADSTNAGYDTRLAGFVSGVDLIASEAGTFSLFAGGAWQNTDVALSQEIDTESFFGGLYGTLNLGTSALDLGLAAGWSNYESVRRVADMNAPDGLATAEADYDGFFISPHVELTTPFTLGGQAFEAKGALRYAGLFLDAFDETGTSGDLAVDARDIHLITARAALSMPVEHGHANGATRFIPAIGIEARVQFGDDDVSGTLAGTGVTFDADNGETLAGFLGFRAEHETASGLGFFAEGEALFEDGGERFSAKGGVSARF